MNDLLQVPHSGDLQLRDWDNLAWQNAPVAILDHLCSGELAPPSRRCDARLLWTNSALLVRFDCRQDEPVVATEKPDLSCKTLDLFNRDVVEIFIAPQDLLTRRYYEFEAAPNGEWLDLMLHRDSENEPYQPDWNWISGMTTAARSDDKNTIIVMRIPWRSIGRMPRKGEEWRANLFRCAGAPQSYLSWQVTNAPGFHVPERFGRLRFV